MHFCHQELYVAFALLPQLDMIAFYAIHYLNKLKLNIFNKK